MSINAGNMNYYSCDMASCCLQLGMKNKTFLSVPLGLGFTNTIGKVSGLSGPFHLMHKFLCT